MMAPALEPVVAIVGLAVIRADVGDGGAGLVEAQESGRFARITPQVERIGGLGGRRIEHQRRGSGSMSGGEMGRCGSRGRRLVALRTR